MNSISSAMRQNRPSLLVLFAVLVLGLCLVYALFGQRPLDFDESGIFNAPYMMAYYSEVSYPVWVGKFPESFESYWFHPPTYYSILGVLLKFMSIYYAEGLLPTVIFALCVYFAATMRAPRAVKYAYLLAVFTQIVVCVTVQLAHFGTRPDMAASLTWFAGLLALEKGRLGGWKSGTLLSGAFLVVLASAYHYITAFFSLGLVVYAILVLRRLEGTRRLKALGALVLGGCLFGVPYLIFYFIPNFDHIVTWMTTAAHSNLHGHDPIAILKFKLETQSSWNLQWNPVTLFKLIPGGLHALYVPIGLVSSLGMLLFRDTRIIGWATLPEVVFLYFVADKIQYYYIIQEYILLFILSSYILMWLISILLRYFRLSSIQNSVLFATGILAAAYLTAASPGFRFAIRHAGTVQHHWMDVARAASQSIVGTDAIVGEYIALWYLSGGRYWYPEGFGRPRHVPDDEEAYIKSTHVLAHYDLRTVDDQIAYHATDGRKIIGGWVGSYAQGKLRFNGVVNVPGTPIVFYSVNQPHRLHHYQINTDLLRVERFEEADGGDTVLGTYICRELGDQPNGGFFDYHHAFATFLEIDGDNPQVIGIFRTSVDRFETMRKMLDSDCRIKESHSGTVAMHSFSEFMAMVPEFHTKMSFFRSPAEAVAAKKRNARN